jgi:hypothetical protein
MGLGAQAEGDLRVIGTGGTLFYCECDSFAGQ